MSLDTLPTPCLSPTQLDDFQLNYWRERAKGYEGKYYRMRYGEAFCQEFDVTNNSLFYATDEARALDLMELYVVKAPRRAKA